MWRVAARRARPGTRAWPATSRRPDRAGAPRSARLLAKAARASRAVPGRGVIGGWRYTRRLGHRARRCFGTKRSVGPDYPRVGARSALTAAPRTRHQKKTISRFWGLIINPTLTATPSEMSRGSPNSSQLPRPLESGAGGLTEGRADACGRSLCDCVYGKLVATLAIQPTDSRPPWRGS